MKKIWTISVSFLLILFIFNTLSFAQQFKLHTKDSLGDILIKNKKEKKAEEEKNKKEEEERKKAEISKKETKITYETINNNVPNQVSHTETNVGDEKISIKIEKKKEEPKKQEPKKEEIKRVELKKEEPENIIVEKKLEPSDSSIQIDRGVIAKDVDGRTPLGVSNEFSADVGKLFCFTEVSGAESGEKISHAWYYRNKVRAIVELSLRKSRTYTWSFFNIPKGWDGDWEVHVLDEDGKLIKNIPFHLE